jgi:hypothetical protein
MILQGPAPSGLDLATPALITSLAEAEALGIDADYDTDNSVDAHKAIKEFYDIALTGAQLWIMVVAQAASLTTILDVAEANYAKLLLDAANGGIRILTVVRNPAGGYSPTVTNGIDADVETAITKAQALAVAYTAQYKPFRVILPVYAYNDTPGDLPDLRALTANRVAVMLGDTASGATSAVGIALGRAAAIPVQRNLGRVKDNALPITAAYIGTSTVEEAAGDVATIHDKGFITFRRHVGFAGYYFSDDPMAAPASDDYGQLANGRVIDKAIFLAYRTYVQELLDEVLIDPATGQIQRGQAKYLQEVVRTVIDNQMTASGEISGVSVEVDPAQNVLSTGKVCIKIRITPVGYLREIEVELGFVNNANA